MTQFHETRMGLRFYEHTLPELVRQLTRLNENLERLADLHVQADEPQPSDRKDSHDPEDGTEEGTNPPHAR